MSARVSKKNAYFSGHDALAEVGKADGELNWAMVGSDPEKLPLAGCGSGGVEELRKALGEHMVSFGLLRLEFFSITERVTEMVYISAVMGSGTTKEKRAALTNARKMKKAIVDASGGGEADLEFQVQSSSDLAEQTLCDRLSASEDDNDTYTVLNYRKGLKMFRDRHSEAAREEEAREQVALEARQLSSEKLGKIESQILDDDDFNITQTMQPSMSFEERVTEIDSSNGARIGNRFFKVGDAVMVFCDSARTWQDDGIILLVLRDEECYDNYKLPPGAIKVQYGGGSRFKWVLSDHVNRFLKPSQRPTPPSPMMGELFKETHNIITEWHVRHAEINRGFMHWWQNPDDARLGFPPNAVVVLLGMTIHVEEESTVFRISTASPKGTMFTFDATTPEGRDRWMRALEKHANYCNRLQEHLLRKKREAAEEAGGLHPDHID